MLPSVHPCLSTCQHNWLSRVLEMIVRPLRFTVQPYIMRPLIVTLARQSHNRSVTHEVSIPRSRTTKIAHVYLHESCEFHFNKVVEHQFPSHTIFLRIFYNIDNMVSVFVSFIRSILMPLATRYWLRDTGKR